ncbi:hypothetical protein D3C80_1701590 [compost metagenome]
MGDVAAQGAEAAGDRRQDDIQRGGAQALAAGMRGLVHDHAMIAALHFDAHAGTHLPMGTDGFDRHA